MFHVKEHLTAEDLHKRGLASTLAAMQVADYSNHQHMKQLCQYLCPNYPFLDIFDQNLKLQRKYVDLASRKKIFLCECYG